MKLPKFYYSKDKNSNSIFVNFTPSLSQVWYKFKLEVCDFNKKNINFVYGIADNNNFAGFGEPFLSGSLTKAKKFLELFKPTNDKFKIVKIELILVSEIRTTETFTDVQLIDDGISIQPARTFYAVDLQRH